MTDSFDDVLTRLTRRVGDQATRTEATEAGFDLAEVRGEGEARDGELRVVMQAGRFTEVTIDVRAMRLSNVELAEALLEAVNAASDAHAAALAEAVREDAGTDFGALQADLRDIQTQSLTAMRTYTDSLFDALAQARRLAPDVDTTP